MSDDKKQDDDEDLMSDFKDLFPEEGEEASSDDAAKSDSDGSEALDELDAMLDDFEQNFDSATADDEAEAQGASDGEDAPVLTDEVSVAPGEEDEDRQLELDKDELDLAVSEAPAEEVFDDSWGEGQEDATEEAEEEEREAEQEAPAVAAETPDDTSKPEPEPTQESHDPLSEVAEIAAGSASAAAVAESQSAPAGGMSRAMVWSVIAVMLVSLGVSGFAAWLALGVDERLDEMDNTLQQLEANLPAAGKGDTAAVGAMRTELRTLAARVNELAVVIEGPMSHLRESNEDTLADIEQRLRKLEGGAPKTTSKPLVEKKPAAAAKPAEKPAAASKDGWAINLISLSDEKDAEAELKRLRSLGVRAEKQRAVKDGKTWYRLQVRGFTSYEGAKAYIETVEKKAGVKNAWVAKD